MPAHKTAKPTEPTASDASSDNTLILSAALPYKIKDGQVYVLFVTSRENGRWIIPRGKQEKGEMMGEAAKREAREEAGINGEIIAKEGKYGAIGSYRSLKKLSSHEIVPTEIHVFLLRKTSTEKSWRERAERERRWVTIGDAIKLIQGDNLESGLVALLESLQQNPPDEFLKPPDRPKRHSQAGAGCTRE